MVKQRILKLEVELIGIEYRWALVFLALTHDSPSEGRLHFQQVILEKKATRGRHTTIITVETDEKTYRGT